MYSIQTLNNISPKGLALLADGIFQQGPDVSDPSAYLLRSYSLHDRPIPGSILAIARAGAGVNNIPVDACTARGIVVFNTPGANANSVKELVIAGLLLSARAIHEGLAWTATLKGKAGEVPALVEKEKSRFAGTEILGKKLGVIGLGAIGSMVANAAVALGMDVIGFDPYISVDAAWGLRREVRRARSLESLLGESDYVTIHVPLVDETKHMMNRQRFGMMKKGCRLLNFARGGLVNNADLLEAIAGGLISHYVTDFPEDDLLGNPGVLAVPHLGASTEEAEDNCAVMAAKQLRDFLSTGIVRNSVNFPNCEMDPTSRSRILITNRNVPNMVGQITTLLASEGINIADMLNKHRNEFAFNIIDIEGDLNTVAIDKLRGIDGVISVRVLENPAANI